MRTRTCVRGFGPRRLNICGQKIRKNWPQNAPILTRRVSGRGGGAKVHALTTRPAQGCACGADRASSSAASTVRVSTLCLPHAAATLSALGALLGAARATRRTTVARRARLRTRPHSRARLMGWGHCSRLHTHRLCMRRLHHTPKQMAVERDAAMGDGEKLPWGARGRAPEGTPSRAVRRERSMAGRPGRLVATQRRVSRAPALRRCRCRMSVGQEGYRLLKGWWTPGVARGGNAGEPAAGQAAPATLTAAALAGGGVRRCGASDSQRQQL